MKKLHNGPLNIIHLLFIHYLYCGLLHILTLFHKQQIDKKKYII